MKSDCDFYIAVYLQDSAQKMIWILTVKSILLDHQVHALKDLLHSGEIWQQTKMRWSRELSLPLNPSVV